MKTTHLDCHFGDSVNEKFYHQSVVQTKIIRIERPVLNS